MNTFNDRFFEDVKIVREEADCAEALERLVADERLFTRMTTFWGNSWNVLYRRVEERGVVGVPISGVDAWKDLLRPTLFLAIREMSIDLWNGLFDDDMRRLPQHHEESSLYTHLRNEARAGIELFLLDGNKLAGDVRREEESWPMVYDEDTDEMVPYDPIGEDDTEEEALVNVFAHQIMSELSEKDIDILIADHGDGLELSEKYGMSEEAIRTRRTRLIKKLREKYNDY